VTSWKPREVRRLDLNDKISRSSLHIEVADRVRDMIFDRSLPPGHRIDELDLSGKLGTSRTPLREALKVLANEGLVRLAPGRGAYVTELSPQEVDSLFPVLAMLEARCAAEAVRRQSASDVRRLDAIHQKMEMHVAAGDTQAYHRSADQLHQQLHMIAGNPWLLRATSDLRRFLRLTRGMIQESGGRLLQSLAEHRTLMKTIARGDADSAEQVMHHHLLAQQKAWRTALANQQRATAEAEATLLADAAVAHGNDDDQAANAGAAPAASASGAFASGASESPTAPKPPAAPVSASAPVQRPRTSAEQQPEAESIGV
jgi:DNA-binding GntR family transcriptional regulator